MWREGGLLLLLFFARWGQCVNVGKISRVMEEMKRDKAGADKLVVIVTGASSGIGKAIALELAGPAGEKRFRVWATMRDPSKWDGGSGGGGGGEDGGQESETLRIGTLDVTSEESVAALVDRVIKEEGRIDILVNNAGFGLSGYLETVHVDEAKALFEVNVWGVVRMLHATLPHMRKARRGYVINISSTSGMRGIPCFDFYTSSKFALEGMTDSMRYALAPFNISVTNLNAGPVVTKFTDRFGNAETGGRGTRDLIDTTGYLDGLNEYMVLALNQRMASAEAQTAQSVGVIVHHLALRKFVDGRGRITDVPFNMGTSPESQKVIEDVRVNPTGWGGAYTRLLANLPPMHHNGGEEERGGEEEGNQKQQQQEENHKEL